MSDAIIGSPPIGLGDPVPWFGAAVVTGGSFDLHVSAGRWVTLIFAGSLGNPQAVAEVSEIAREGVSFGEDHLVIGCVLTEPPGDLGSLAAIGKDKLVFLADYDGAISRSFGALDKPRTFVLDPMLRAIADVCWDVPQGHAQTICSVLRGLPSVDDSAGVPMFAPALLVPRVFSFEI